jgi:hypothetical protein
MREVNALSNGFHLIPLFHESWGKFSPKGKLEGRTISDVLYGSTLLITKDENSEKLDSQRGSATPGVFP